MNQAEVGVGVAMGQAQENQSGSGHGGPSGSGPSPRFFCGSPDPHFRGEGESGSRDAALSARCCHVSSLCPFPTMSVYPLGSQIND